MTSEWLSHRAGSANLPTRRISCWVGITACVSGCLATRAFGRVWCILDGTRRIGSNGSEAVAVASLAWLLGTREAGRGKDDEVFSFQFSVFSRAARLRERSEARYFRGAKGDYPGEPACLKSERIMCR